MGNALAVVFTNLLVQMRKLESTYLCPISSCKVQLSHHLIRTQAKMVLTNNLFNRRAHHVIHSEELA